MKKWYKDIDTQRLAQAEERSSRHTGTSETEFTYMKNVQNMQNPYQQEYEAEEELAKEAGFFSEFPMSRNSSSTNLRTRSATGGSGGSGPLSAGRPPRFPMPDTPLAVHTQLANGSMSPGERTMPSYFSPTETPSTSTRSSSQSVFPYRQPTSSATWGEESNRYTAPAMSRGASRDGTNGNPYFSSSNSGRGAQRPSLPPLSGPQGQANGMAQARMRSASSPDIHQHIHHLRMAGQADNVPVPPIPAHMANMRAPVNRSQNNSPTNSNLPIRSATQSPGVQQQNTQRHTQPTQFHEPQYSTQPPTLTPSQSSASDQPPSPLSEEPEQQVRKHPPPISEDPLMPSQLKAKVNFDDNYVTLVIATNILFQTLTDRVDAKLARFTNRSIGGKSVRLRYKDEDGDFVTIDSDEAVQLAFMEWRDQHQEMLAQGQVGEFQLFCQTVEN